MNIDHGEQNPLSGYIGAVVVLVVSVAISLNKKANYIFIDFTLFQKLLLMLLFTLIAMLVAEFFGRKSYIKIGVVKLRPSVIPPNISYLLRSAFFRWLSLTFMFFIMWYCVKNHYYFTKEPFQLTRKFFDYVFLAYLILGYPYIVFTLHKKWGIFYEYNDYGILLMIAFKSTVNFIFQKNNHQYLARLKNRRIKKVFLVYLVNFFFGTLMIQFLLEEFRGFDKSLHQILADNFSTLSFFKQYHTWYLVFYYELFVIDVSIAIIGYFVASRWLDNRTRNVETTMSGWIAAIMCYPPMNTGFTNQFINYNSPATYNLITNEIALMIIMALILICFTIYVWATLVLGFRFSNLTNRGIITRGPYSVVRHPAYISKNLAWWLDNTFVLSNLWTSIALVVWNLIYILRGFTEERNLSQDPNYREYCETVKWRFIPKVF
ncbi:Isoprenylcysteine carboxylmethyltransferase family protein [Gammaproteobacteria bacterium]